MLLTIDLIPEEKNYRESQKQNCGSFFCTGTSVLFQKNDQLISRKLFENQLFRVYISIPCILNITLDIRS